MANQLGLLLLTALWFGLAVKGGGGGGARSKLLSSNGLHGVDSPAPAVEGTCKSIVETYGYECREYTVTTKDGYVLSMQRIPEGHSRHSKIAGNKQPVLLQHGVLMDGVTWLLNPPPQSLAYILADNGFDVWIANSRGTRWSRRHTFLQIDDPAYWNWSWDELVQYDLPSTFDFVYEQTGQKLHYIGTSMGTLTALASFSQGKLLDMVKSASFLAPVVYLSHINSGLARLGAKLLHEDITYWLEIAEFDPKGGVVGRLLDYLCHSTNLNCYDLMTIFTGKNCCLNTSTIDFFLKYEPQSTSTKTMIHLSQMFLDGSLAMYDYEDDDENMKHYGQIKPPVYNMSIIPNDIPLFFSHGGKDSLSDANDVGILLDDLKFHDKDKQFVQYVNNYAHADFVMAINAKETVYEPLVAFLNDQ